MECPRIAALSGCTWAPIPASRATASIVSVLGRDRRNGSSGWPEMLPPSTAGLGEGSPPTTPPRAVLAWTTREIEMLKRQGPHHRPGTGPPELPAGGRRGSMTSYCLHAPSIILPRGRGDPCRGWGSSARRLARRFRCHLPPLLPIPLQLLRQSPRVARGGRRPGPGDAAARLRGDSPVHARGGHELLLVAADGRGERLEERRPRAHRGQAHAAGPGRRAA